MSKRNHTAFDVRYAMQVASRAIAALFGGYALAAMTTAGLSRWLPLPRVEAVMTGMLSSFAIYATVAIVAFAVNRAWRIWLYLAIAGVPLAIALACIGPGMMP